MGITRNIAFYSPHATYAINWAAKAVIQGGYDAYCFLNKEISHLNSDHETCYRELARDPRIKLLDPKQAGEFEFSHLFALWSVVYPYSPRDYEDLRRLLRKSRKVGALCHLWFPSLASNLKGTWKYLRSYPELALRTRSFGYEEMPQPPGLHALWAKRYLVGCGPHPRYFHDPEIEELLYSPWGAAAPRRWKFNFLGTAAPEQRAALLSAIRRHLSEDARGGAGLEIVDDYPESARAFSRPVAFIRTPSPGEVRPRPHDEYLRCVTDSDFTLCVPGYTIWSCRPAEALLRGSIPVLDQREVEEFLDMPLLDGKNCIVVRGQDWPKAIDRALTIPPEGLIQMRNDIALLKRNYLDLDAWSSRLRHKMGLE